MEKGHDEYAAKAHGMLIQLEVFDTFFGLKLAHLIFPTFEQFSINLQSVDITLQEAIRGAQFLVKHFKSQRNESKFDAFYMDVVCQASSKITTKNTPRRYDSGKNPHHYIVSKDRHDTFSLRHWK